MYRLCRADELISLKGSERALRGKLMDHQMSWGRLIGCLISNDDGNGNENVKKATSSITKTITLHVHYTFWYISLPSGCTTRA